MNDAQKLQTEITNENDSLKKQISQTKESL